MGKGEWILAAVAIGAIAALGYLGITKLGEVTAPITETVKGITEGIKETEKFIEEKIAPPLRMPAKELNVIISEALEPIAKPLRTPFRELIGIVPTTPALPVLEKPIIVREAPTLQPPKLIVPEIPMSTETYIKRVRYRR